MANCDIYLYTFTHFEAFHFIIIIIIIIIIIKNTFKNTFNST